MELLAHIIFLPASLFLDLIPKAFKFKGLFDWYAEKNGGYANDVIPIYVFINLVVFITAYLSIHI